MENLEEKKIDDILKDIHNDFIEYFDNIDIPKEGSTSFHGKNYFTIILIKKIRISFLHLILN